MTERTWVLLIICVTVICLDSIVADCYKTGKQSGVCEAGGGGVKAYCFFMAVIKYILVCFLWQGLELFFYKKIQPRIVDDIIGLVLLWYIYKAEGR